MGRARVAIVYHDSLFAEGLASLLRAEPSIELLEVVAADASASERIRMLWPAVVILEGDPAKGEPSLHAGQLLEVTPCVVEVGLNHETVAIHQRAQLRQGNNFVNLVARLARRARVAWERGDV